MILPAGFEELFKESLGSDAFERYSSVISANPTACVRINPSKFEREEFMALWPDAQQVPWCSNGFYLRERPNFTLDPLFHAGAYYVQDASSMFLEAMFRQITVSCLEQDAENPVVSAAYFARSDSSIQHPGPSFATIPDICSFAGKSVRVLDLCAAPGGKSTHLLSLLGPDSLLVSNEVISSRTTILKENLAIWGAANAVVTSFDSEVFAVQLPEFFDIVLVDAPCSGEGMFRKMENSSGNAATENWSLENVKLCAARQQRILSSAVKCLKPGGWLIYSTCTFNHFENDDQLAFLKSEFGLEVNYVTQFDAMSDASSAPVLVKTLNGGYQFISGMVQGEGQFCALLQLPFDPAGEDKSLAKSGTSGNGSSNFTFRTKFKKNNSQNAKKMIAGFQVKVPQAIEPLIASFKDAGVKVNLRLQGELYKILPDNLASDIDYVASAVRVLGSGIALGCVKGKDFIPDAQLATADILYNYYGPDISFETFGVAHKTAFRPTKTICGICGSTAFKVHEVDRETALKFLAKQLTSLEDAPLGVLLISYRGKGLGFVKNIGKRINSFLPNARRILNLE